MRVRNRRWPLVFGASACLLACGQPASVAPDASAAPRVLELTTSPLAIDRIYTSMEGPHARVVVDPGELDWVTAYRSDVINDRDGEKMGDEFFCHSQLQMSNSTRLLITATGSEEIVFPPGFAMPVSRILDSLPPAERPISLLGMVLNNHVAEIDELARIRWRIEYWRDEDLRVAEAPEPRRLYKVSLAMAVEDLSLAIEPPPDPTPGEAATHCVLVEKQPTHWIVPPGPQITRRRFSGIMPLDANVHFASVHLHNHGRYFKLTDLTTGEELWRTDVVYEADRVQIAEIPSYSSAAGFRMYRDHEYEIEAFYDNTSGSPVDAMANIDLYYHPPGGEHISYPEGPLDDRPVSH